MTLLELSISGALDKFGHPFRNWDVVARKDGTVPPDYVCWLYCDWEPKPIEAIKPTASQMDLFA